MLAPPPIRRCFAQTVTALLLLACLATRGESQEAAEPQGFQPIARFGFDFWDEPVSYTGTAGFNVFFDNASISSSGDYDTEQEITSLELAKQHVFYASEGLNSVGTGWRLEAYHDDWQGVVGDEAPGLWGVEAAVADSFGSGLLRETLRAARFSTYGTAGLRGIHHESEFSFEGTGSIIGRTAVYQTIDHYAFGPQLGLGVVAETSMFRFEAVALGLVGYGRVENKQRGVFGEEVIPGTLNRSVVALATNSGVDSDEEHVAWHGETRLTGSCQLSQRLRFDATWRWFITGPAHDALEAVAWNAPDYGFRQASGGHFTSSDFFLGLTYTH